MFTLSIALIPLIIAVLFAAIHFSATRYNWEPGKWSDTDRGYNYKGAWLCGVYWMLFFALMLAASAVIKTMNSYGNHFDNVEYIAQLDATEMIYEERAETLTTQFRKFLVEQYPDHEMGIFDKISPDTIDIYLAKYPEIKSSDTVLELVAQIRSMQDDKYAQQIERERVMKWMRYRKVNPWILNSYIPELPF